MATATHRIAAAIASQNARSIYCYSQSFQNLFLRLVLANLRVNHSSFGKQDLFSDNIFQFFLFLAFHFLDFFFIDFSAITEITAVPMISIAASNPVFS